MENGTIKTETWAHFNGVGQEYFRFEIITRWWKGKDDSTEWKHTIISIDRDGSMSEYMQKEGDDSQVRDFKKLMDSFVTTAHTISGGSKERTMICDQHHQLVRMTLG